MLVYQRVKHNSNLETYSPSKVSEFPTIRMLWKIVHCLNGGVPLITDDLDDDLLGTPHDLDVEAPNAFNTWPATQQLS